LRFVGEDDAVGAELADEDGCLGRARHLGWASSIWSSRLSGGRTGRRMIAYFCGPVHGRRSGRRSSSRSNSGQPLARRRPSEGCFWGGHAQCAGHGMMPSPPEHGHACSGELGPGCGPGALGRTICGRARDQPAFC
jgi:hypothetical protein